MTGRAEDSGSLNLLQDFTGCAIHERHVSNGSRRQQENLFSLCGVAEPWNLSKQRWRVKDTTGITAPGWPTTGVDGGTLLRPYVQECMKRVNEWMNENLEQEITKISILISCYSSIEIIKNEYCYHKQSTMFSKSTHISI